MLTVALQIGKMSLMKSIVDRGLVTRNAYGKDPGD